MTLRRFLRGVVLVAVLVAGAGWVLLSSLTSVLLHPSLCRHQSAFYNVTELKGINGSVVAAGRCLPQPRYFPLIPDNQNDCTLPYVTINRGGRIGNEICQYMSLAVLRVMFGVRASIHQEMHKYISQFFSRLTLPVEDHACFLNYSRQIHFDDLYRTLVANDSPSGPALPGPRMPRPYPINESLYIYNNPCPPDLLLPFREQFRQEFTFGSDIVGKARARVDAAINSLGYLANETVTKITVHVRRKDYITFLKEKFSLEPAQTSYFQRAFDFFRERVPEPVFLVTSDDPKWCLENLKHQDVVYVGSNESVVDLALLTLGDHHVMTDGTFGYVGAFLSRGIIVYPQSENSWPFFRCINSTIYQPISRD
nr:galactoside alpha-(1,2)-fucosyltransferase 1-like [Procambarus clarkii]